MGAYHVGRRIIHGRSILHGRRYTAWGGGYYIEGTTLHGEKRGEENTTQGGSTL